MLDMILRLQTFEIADQNCVVCSSALHAPKIPWMNRFMIMEKRCTGTSRK